MSISIRRPKLSETSQIIRMWQISFGDSDEFTKWYFENRYSPARTLAAFDGDKAVASMQLFERTFRIRDNLIPCRFIVGACTLPEYRRQGLMRALLAQAAQSYGAITLYPADTQFYKKLGWGTFAYSYKITVQPDDKQDIKNCAAYDDINIKELYELFKQKIASYPTALGRSIRDMYLWCAGELADGSKILHMDGSYAIYKEEQNKIKVSEAVLRDNDLKYIASCLSKYGKPVEFSLSEPYEEAQAVPGGMLRLNPDVLEGLKAPEGADRECAVYITDPLRVCSGGYRIEAKCGIYRVTRTDDYEEAMDIGEFSSIAAGGIKYTGRGFKMKKLFPDSDTACFDKY
ncbi:MAG TPA: GNAT family N-acetyltransferase [Clostridia bacterium]|nr:GNAT family N-acetyltransferase [Clostridia bacterium]